MFEGAIERRATDEEARQQLQKVRVRLQEQQTSNYDFKRLSAEVSVFGLRINAANFFNRTEVRHSPGRGKGLFATMDMQFGDLVLVEKAFCALWSHEEHALITVKYNARTGMASRGHIGLWRDVMQKCCQTHRLPRTSYSYMATTRVLGRKR